MTTPPVPRSPPRRRTRRPLDLSSLRGFPFRKQLGIDSDAEGRAETIAPAVLEEAGFTRLVGPEIEADWAGRASQSSLTWVGERGVRRQGVTSSTAVIPMIVVFAAGAVLGGLDGFLLGSPEIGIFWVLGAAGLSGLFWLVYGGTYDSDLVLLSVLRPAPLSESRPNSVSIVLWAARIRSQSRADRRYPTDVSGPLKLAAEVGQLVGECERRMTTARPPPRSATPDPH